MTQFTRIPIPKVASLDLSLEAPNRLTMSGRITIRDPGDVLSGFIRGLHERALSDRLTEICVDVTGLTFVNSSALRLFVDWAMWVKALPAPGYKLRFVTDRRITWQNTSFSALVAMVGDVLQIEGRGL